MNLSHALQIDIATRIFQNHQKSCNLDFSAIICLRYHYFWSGNFVHLQFSTPSSALILPDTFEQCLRIRAATSLRTSKSKWAKWPQFLSHFFYENTAMLLPTRYDFTINETFQMRYCMKIYIKGHHTPLVYAHFCFFSSQKKFQGIGNFLNKSTRW